LFVHAPPPRSVAGTRVPFVSGVGWHPCGTAGTDRHNLLQRKGFLPWGLRASCSTCSTSTRRNNWWLLRLEGGHRAPAATTRRRMPTGTGFLRKIASDHRHPTRLAICETVVSCGLTSMSRTPSAPICSARRRTRGAGGWRSAQWRARCECLGKLVSVDDEREARDLVAAAVADGLDVAE
jgi:hypothetical protein